MNAVVAFLSKLLATPPEQMVGLISLVALGLAIFALYVVLTVVRQKGRRVQGLR